MNLRHALGAFTLLVSTICAATTAAPTAAAADLLKGSWTLARSERSDQVRFGITHSRDGGRSQHEADWPITALQGLDVATPGKRDVRFEIGRDAGRFDCEGYLKDGEGAGLFVFTPDPRFAARMAAAGFPGIDADRQFAMAIHDVTVEFARTMRAQNLSGLDGDKLIAFRIFDVSAPFIAGLRTHGLAADDADMLVAFRVHGVSPEFVRSLAQLGFAAPPPAQLVAMRIHGVTPEFIGDMRSRGLRNLTIEQLINLRVHGLE